MSDLNRIILTGRLTRDPMLNKSDGGVSICRMRIAVNGPRDQDGVQRVEYIDVVAFNAQAENCQRYLRKGRRVSVDGRLSYSEWETDDGSRRSRLEAIGQIGFLDPKPQNGTQDDERTSDGAPNGTTPETAQSNGTHSSSPQSQSQAAPTGAAA